MNLFYSLALAEEAAAQEAQAAVEEAAAKADPTWLQDALSKFGKLTPTTWVALGALVAIGLVLLAISRSSKKWTAKTIAYASLSIALSFVLSCIRLYRMPQGGSVTPGSMLPVMLFSAAYGLGPGLAAGTVYGLLQYLQGGEFLNFWQFLLDYVLAFTALGLAGLAKNLPKTWGIYAAIILAALARCVSATLAGFMFWGSALWPSLVYNGTYLIPDTLICIVLAFLIARPVMKILQSK